MPAPRLIRRAIGVLAPQPQLSIVSPTPLARGCQKRLGAHSEFVASRRLQRTERGLILEAEAQCPFMYPVRLRRHSHNRVRARTGVGQLAYPPHTRRCCLAAMDEHDMAMPDPATLIV